MSSGCRGYDDPFSHEHTAERCSFSLSLLLSLALPRFALTFPSLFSLPQKNTNLYQARRSGTIRRVNTYAWKARRGSGGTSMWRWAQHSASVL